jgi:hypothetical protein
MLPDRWLLIVTERLTIVYSNLLAGAETNSNDNGILIARRTCKHADIGRCVLA